MINKLTYERKTAGPLYCLYILQCNWQLIDFDKAGGADHHYIIIMLLIEADCPFVCSIVATVQKATNSIRYYTPETAYHVCSSLGESRVYSTNPKVSPALV